VDHVAYADLAVRLVNSAGPGRKPGGRGDGIASAESYRELVADRPHLAGKVTAGDLEALRLLREELRTIFVAAADDRAAEAVEKLNALLTRHPIHQQVTRHDGGKWHIHLVESGSAADKYAAGAIAGLTGVITESGTDPLGVCAAERCQRAFIAVGADKDKQYCSDKCAPKASVRALRARGQTGAPGSASTATG
jgi:Putative stress-induced transcription regulator/CGNR zinc finger